MAISDVEILAVRLLTVRFNVFARMHATNVCVQKVESLKDRVGVEA